MPAKKDSNLLHYNAENRTFEPIEWNEELIKAKQNSFDDKKFDAIDETIPALLMPIYENSQVRQILIKTTQNEQKKIAPPIISRKKYGVLFIKLDKNAIEKQIFPDLVKKYFSKRLSRKNTATAVAASDCDSI